VTSTIDAPLSTGLLAREGEQVGRILAAAERCFGSAGYEAASLREIAAEAGVSKSLLHYHFQSKEHLYLEVLVRIYNRLAVRITEAVAERGLPAERALLALDALFDALRESPDFQVQAMVWAHSLSDERLRAHAQRMHEHLRSEIVRTMERILGPAHQRLPISLEVAADLLWATVGGLGLQASTNQPERVERAFQGFRQLVALALAGGVSAGA